MRGDSQHQLEEVQDWAAHLEHLQSILVEFDADCAPLEGQLGRTFYDGLRPSIKLWIDEVGRQQLSWDELVTAANRAEVKARIHNNHHRKRPLKLTFKDSGEQTTEKAQPKATASGLSITPSAKSSSSSGHQSEQGSEDSKKARREKKKKQNRGRRKRREASTPASGSNQTPTAGKKKQARIEAKIRTFHKLPVGTVIRRAIMQLTLPSSRSQKTSCSLGDLHVGDC